MSRGEQNRRSSVVSKTGISLAAPPVFEEGERSDARRKDWWCGQGWRLFCASLKSINNSSIVTPLRSSAMCSTLSDNKRSTPPRPPNNSASLPAVSMRSAPRTSGLGHKGGDPAGHPAARVATTPLPGRSPSWTFCANGWTARRLAPTALPPPRLSGFTPSNSTVPKCAAGPSKITWLTRSRPNEFWPPCAVGNAPASANSGN